MPHQIEWRKSPTESATFGREIFRAHCNQTSLRTGILQEAIRELPIGSGAFLKTIGLPCRKEVQMMSDRIPGFVECEPLIYWEAQSRTTEEPTRILSFLEDPIEITNLVKSTFSNYRNHYSDDPETSSRIIVSAAYADWAINSVSSGSGRFLVLDSFQGVQGFALVAHQESHMEIMLAGTPPEFRRQGFYTELMSALLNSDFDGARRTITISTQISNIEVQRLWARSGFVPQALQGAFHIWL